MHSRYYSDYTNVKNVIQFQLNPYILIILLQNLRKGFFAAFLSQPTVIVWLMTRAITDLPLDFLCTW